jgi:hypothetical protein
MRQPLSTTGITFGCSDHQSSSFFKDLYPKPAHVKKLFRFGAPAESVSSLVVIRDHIFAKVFLDIIEFICEEDTVASDVRMIAWLLTHCHGDNHLLVNTPTPDDPMKLKHIANVKQHGNVKDVVKAITRALAVFPTHFVLQCQYQTDKTLLNSVFMNPESIKRMYSQVNKDMQE